MVPAEPYAQFFSVAEYCWETMTNSAQRRIGTVILSLTQIGSGEEFRLVIGLDASRSGTALLSVPGQKKKMCSLESTHARLPTGLGAIFRPNDTTKRFSV